MKRKYDNVSNKENDLSINSLPNDILKSIFIYVGNRNGFAFLLCKLICTKWNDLIIELIENYSKYSIGKSFWDGNLIPIASHLYLITTTGKWNDDFISNFVTWNQLAKKLNYRHILKFFSELDDIFGFTSKLFSSSFVERLRDLDKKIHEKAIKLWGDTKIFKQKNIKQNELCYLERNLKSSSLNEEFILGNLDKIGNYIFELNEWKSVLELLHKRNILNPSLIKKWFSNPKEMDDDTIIFFLNELDPLYVSEIEICEPTYGYVAIPYIYLRYKEQIDEVILDDFNNIPSTFIHFDIYDEAIDTLLLVQINNNPSKWFGKWLSYLNELVVNFKTEIRPKNFFKFMRIIKRYIELCENLDFITSKQIRIISKAKLYKLLKFIQSRLKKENDATKSPPVFLQPL